ncbi:MAG: O-antigen ligase family protein [Rubricoccaceae bacterium]|nr:O-antigen ligase family protein [Rubricoccaceae bacterium]
MPDRVVRYGGLLFHAGFLLTLAAVVLVSVYSPEILIFIPLGLVSLAMGILLFRHERINFVIWLGGFALLLSSDEGYQIHEVLYGLYFYAYLLYWYAERLLVSKRAFVRGPVDVAVALWIVLGVLLGGMLGLIFGAPITGIRNEVLVLSVLAIYFPIKEYCLNEQRGALTVLALIAWLGIFVTIDNSLTALSVFRSAEHLWEIADVRIAGRELTLTFSATLLLAFIPTSKSWKHTILAGTTLIVTLAGLLVTKSRTFWVALLIAISILIILAPPRERRRLIFGCLSGVTILLLVGLVFLGEYFQLVWTGLTNRFSSIGSAYSDVSLINRFVETDKVFSHISANPVIGHGLGSEFSFFNLIHLQTVTTNYIHNSYFAVWFKLGLWGCLIVLFTWLSVVYKSLAASVKSPASDTVRALARGVVACLVCMTLPVYTSSVFFEDEKIGAFALVAALGVGIFQRSRLLEHKLQRDFTGNDHLK